MNPAPETNRTEEPARADWWRGSTGSTWTRGAFDLLPLPGTAPGEPPPAGWLMRPYPVVALATGWMDGPDTRSVLRLLDLPEGGILRSITVRLGQSPDRRDGAFSSENVPKRDEYNRRDRGFERAYDPPALRVIGWNPGAGCEVFPLRGDHGPLSGVAPLAVPQGWAAGPISVTVPILNGAGCALAPGMSVGLEILHPKAARSAVLAPLLVFSVVARGAPRP